MPDEKTLRVSIVPEFVDKALDNLLEKPCKTIGDTFNDIWYLIIGGPVSQLVEKRQMKYALELDKYKLKIEKEINAIPDERRVEPDLQIAAMALESSKYCISDEEIRNMFAKFIASSMDKNKKKYVLPLYIDIVRKMTANDAKIFDAIIQFKPIDNLNISAEEVYISLESLIYFGLIKGESNYACESCFTPKRRLTVSFLIENGKIVLEPSFNAPIYMKDKIGTYIVTSLGMGLKRICFE